MTLNEPHGLQSEQQYKKEFLRENVRGLQKLACPFGWVSVCLHLAFVEFWWATSEL